MSKSLVVNRADLIETLSKLFAQDINAHTANTTEINYLRSHSQLNSIRRQIDAFEKYISHVKPGNKVLDWGCRHAPDSVMLRKVFGNSVEIHGCDFVESSGFKNFHKFTHMQYTKLIDLVKLPYADQTFDAVIAGGVLEHTAMDYESLKELHRIIKEDGKLIITFLPNRLSYTEFISRLIKKGGHRRLYSFKETSRTLRHYGFIPVYANYHQFIPAQRTQKLFSAIWPLNSILEKLWPSKLFCSSLMFIATRQSVI